MIILRHNHLVAIACQIKDLQKSPIVDSTESYTSTGLTRDFQQIVAKHVPNPSALGDMVYPILALYDKLLQVHNPSVYCHNALNPTYVIIDGDNINLLTSKNSSHGDPFYDLAYFSCRFRLRPEAESILLTHYLERSMTHVEEQRFYLLKLLALAHLSLSIICSSTDVFPLTQPIELNGDARYFDCSEDIDVLWDSFEKGGVEGQLNVNKLHRLLANEISFSTKTGKYLSCEKELLLAKVAPTSINDLPRAIKLKIFSYFSPKELAQIVTVNKEWLGLCLDSLRPTVSMPTNFDSIGHADREKILIALQKTSSLYQPVEFISRLPGSSPWVATYKILINHNPFVVRVLCAEDGSTYFKQEIGMMYFFASMGIAPKIHYSCRKTGVILMDFVENISEWHANIHKDVWAHLGSFFNLMNNVSLDRYASSRFFQNRRLSDTYDRVYRICLKDYVTDYRFNLFRTCLKELDRLKPLCESITKQTLCHNDLHVWNILQQLNGDFSAIDFEYSQLGDRLFDIASLAIFMRLTIHDEMHLLTSFFGRLPSRYEKNKYTLFKAYAWINYLIMGIGALTRLDFEISREVIDELRPFYDYSNDQLVANGIDHRSDLGRFQFAVMFAKQALSVCETEEYRDAIHFFTTPCLESSTHGQLTGMF